MAEGGHIKKKRENVSDKQLIEVRGVSPKWSDYRLVMGPQNTDGLTQNRRGSGYTIPNPNDLGTNLDECGIYEFALLVRGGTKYYPVYLGSTCRCDNQCKNERNKDCGLGTRIFEYCQGGSHKWILFNKAIEHGMKIYVRTRKVNVHEGWEIKKTAARAAEDALLREYDYAWNIRQNGAYPGTNKQRERSVVGIRANPITHPCPFCIATGL